MIQQIWKILPSPQDATSTEFLKDGINFIVHADARAVESACYQILICKLLHCVFVQCFTGEFIEVGVDPAA